MPYPINPGSGGGRGYHNGSKGSYGGGALRIHSKHLILNGIISVNGEDGVGGGGGGAGGSLIINATVFQGGGKIRANGGGGGYSGGLISGLF